MAEIASVVVAPRGELDTELLVVGCLQDERPEVSAVPESARRAALRMAERSGWKGREEQLAQTDAGPEGPVVSLYGLGPRAE
ncbi:MAG: hypothetical protein M3O15_03785, partial [Acidobacteriota bacterium]|nr:hypothetical protein [Acidobacteriota bacterium]